MKDQPEVCCHLGPSLSPSGGLTVEMLPFRHALEDVSQEPYWTLGSYPMHFWESGLGGKVFNAENPRCTKMFIIVLCEILHS